MIVNYFISVGFQLVKYTHSFISITFLIFACWVIIRSIHGVIKSKTYTKLDKFLSFAFIINLYLQLIFGLILFSNLGSSQGNDYLVGEISNNMVSKRLWPIEHIVLMLFALLIANLGLIISIKTGNDRENKELS